MKTRETYRRQAQLLKTLANESRLQIVARLSEGSCHAGELTRLVGDDQTTVSKHLALLRSTGIVESKREGSHVLYWLAIPCVAKFLSCASIGSLSIQTPKESGEIPK